MMLIVQCLESVGLGSNLMQQLFMFLAYQVGKAINSFLHVASFAGATHS